MECALSSLPPNHQPVSARSEDDELGFSIVARFLLVCVKQTPQLGDVQRVVLVHFILGWFSSDMRELDESSSNVNEFHAKRNW